MIAPGQEDLLNDFIVEQEEAAKQAAEPELILGKFKSQEDLANAYRELEKKQGRQSSTPEPSAEPEAPVEYTREQSTADYGDFLSDRFEQAEVNPYEWKAIVEKGGDTSAFIDKLAETGIPRGIIENYEQSFRPQAPATGEGLTETDAQELRQLVGGDDAFKQISNWAASNLPPQELADYNAVVDAGNRDAIAWALRAIQSKMSGPVGTVEPPLIGGSASSKSTVFESKQQVLDAMNKRNAKGQRLYDVDEAYQRKFAETLQRSPVEF